MKPVVSLVVLGFNGFDTVTRNCLESLRPWLDSPLIEVLVLDNGSTDNSAELTRKWCEPYPSVHCLTSEVNLGFAGGMNWGSSHAKGDWLLLVNNDTIFPIYAIDSLLRVVQEAPSNVAMLGPVTNAAGNGQRLWKPGATQNEWLQIGKELHESPTKQLMPTYRCDFFCIAVRADVWTQLGGLDESFGLGYYEDFDFSLRLRCAGFEQMITEDVFVLHTGSASFQGSKEARELTKKNKKLLQKLHPNADFQHTRLGNLAVIEEYYRIKTRGAWSKALEMRYSLRKDALWGDAPRSIIKKFLWHRKINKVSGSMS